MNRLDGGQRFDFDYDRLFDEKVKTVTAIQPNPLYSEKTLDSGSGSRLKSTAGMAYCRNDEQGSRIMSTGLKVNSIEGARVRGF